MTTPINTIIEYGTRNVTVFHRSIGRAPSVLATFERPGPGCTRTLVTVLSVDGEPYSGCAMEMDAALKAMRKEAPGALLDMAYAGSSVVPDLLDIATYDAIGNLHLNRALGCRIDT